MVVVGPPPSGSRATAGATEIARARWYLVCCASLRGSDMLLGGRAAARGSVARQRAPRALPTQGRAKLVFNGVCARARVIYRLWTEISTAQVNERIR